MRKLFGKFDKNVDRLGYWHAAWGLVTAGAGWLWGRVPALHDMGWAELTLMGVATSSVLILVGSAGLVSWRYFHSIETQGVGLVDTDKIARLPNPKSPMTDSEKEEIYDGAHEDLMLFVNDHVFPVFNHLMLIQSEIIKDAAPNESISTLAYNGAFWSGSNPLMSEPASVLSGLSSSPRLFIGFDDMIEAVAQIELRYNCYVNDINTLARDCGIEVRNHPKTSHSWQIWRADHQRMVEAYEAIKRNSRMKKLFRVGRPSRWGEPIGTELVTLENQFLKPQDTAT